MNPDTATVVAVSRKGSHGVDKVNQLSIRLVAGRGVEGDAHYGERVKHRSRARSNPGLPNLRQVHLLHAELHDELAPQGFHVTPGLMGENITTRGVDLLGLPEGARLRLGDSAVVEVTGLRNPCLQLEALQQGLMAACLGRGPQGEPVRKAGVMAVVLEGGEVRASDSIVVEPPPGPHRPLKPV
ncbi:MOSC domain-containing protein [Phenylobacterium sp.]|uniref:MOSC domain-containing protein n=1 Tax=Phenylobacterium sp. TaxID=1871053 RepID=UPI0025DB13B7|nr:MOSC domain-containing protein [Phenylobacterium sp.]MBX3486209.1 MOSC domain-containing protein [Phenylobacterium sp.]MCW5760281.1 MOSC domain-containing protein [Phenylobacterium sp.]